MVIDKEKFSAAMMKWDGDVNRWKVRTRLAVAVDMTAMRIYQLETKGGNVKEPAAKAIAKHLGVKIEALTSDCNAKVAP